MKHLAIAVAVALLASMFAGDGRGQTVKRTLGVRTAVATNTSGAMVHEAILTWTQSVPSGVCADQSVATVTGNNIYRTVAGGASGTETLLASLTPATTTYTDTQVGAGSKYFYTVTGVACQNDGGAAESPMSNEVSVTIPSTFPVTLTAPVLNVTVQ